MVDRLRATIPDSCCGAQPGCCCGGCGRCAKANAKGGASCRLRLHHQPWALLAPQKDLSAFAQLAYHYRVARDPEGQTALQDLRVLVAQGRILLVVVWSGARKAIETAWFEEAATKCAIGVEATPEAWRRKAVFFSPSSC